MKLKKPTQDQIDNVARLFVDLTKGEITEDQYINKIKGNAKINKTMEFENDYLEDDQSQEIKQDIFLNGYLIEFLDECFYCNKGKVTHEKMIDTIDFIMNVNHNVEHYIKSEPLYIDIFNMKVNINVLEQVFRLFEPNI